MIRQSPFCVNGMPASVSFTCCLTRVSGKHIIGRIRETIVDIQGYYQKCRGLNTSQVVKETSDQRLGFN